METVLSDRPLSGGSNGISCRLCDGSAAFAFRKLLLGKHMVAFYRCANCGSLQSEDPYWLAEAYSASVVSIDTGAAQRVLYCASLTHFLLRFLGLRTTLDFGGGAGLLCRLLRDAGHDAYWYDQYASPGYAAGFKASPSDHHDLVTSFEVIEHFPEPRKDIAALFGGQPRAVLLMTELYRDQGEYWPYIAPEEGQHIFFYSLRALEIIGRKVGYHLLICRGFILFLHQSPTAFQRWVLQSLLRPRIVGWIKLVFLSRGDAGAQRDYEILTARVSEKKAAN